MNEQSEDDPDPNPNPDPDPNPKPTLWTTAGYLDADAIRRAMGAGISDLEVAEMIAEVDEAGTGKIQYEDFVKYVYC